MHVTEFVVARVPALRSNLFSGNQHLANCETQDQAHVTPGSRGDFVGLIQIALIEIDNAKIDAGELAGELYGNSTAAAVLAYKKKGTIINRSYQSSADNIVGKMTIRSLDDDMLKISEGLSTDLNARELRPLLGRNLWCQSSSTHAKRHQGRIAPMFTVRENSTKFFIATGNFNPGESISFGPTRLFASLNPGFPADGVEKSGQGLFDNPLVDSALAFDAECTIDIPKADSTGFPEIELRSNFDFGFIQGIKESSDIFEFWGKTARHGRTTTVFTIPPSLKLDTEPGPPHSPGQRVPALP